MRNGKKSVAEKMVYGALDQVVKSIGSTQGEGQKVKAVVKVVVAKVVAKVEAVKD